MQKIGVFGHQEGCHVVPHGLVDGGGLRHHPDLWEKSLFYKLVFSHHFQQLLFH